MHTKYLHLLLLPILFFFWLSGAAYAQSPNDEFLPIINWQELKTKDFIVVYAVSIDNVDSSDCVCGIEKAQFYATFIDEVYEDLATVFETELETPINLRLFPTEQSYYEVNPIAEQIPGVIAHALNGREEIAVALPRTISLTEEELINNMRHEMTHLFASLMSNGKLNTGFQEGVAQYLEKPIEQSSYDPALLQKAFDQQRLLTWADMDKAEQIFRDPQVAYPQALSMTSFLVDRYGFPKLVDFIKINADEPGYRSALEVTYGKPADELEQGWLDYLPEYFAGRWKINSIYAYDLSRARQLVDGGAYTAAEVELVDVIELLETTDQQVVLAEAEFLLSRVHQGQAANALADEARGSFEQDDYALTITKGNAALAAYEELGYRDRVSEVQTYIQRAELGQNAISQLNRGQALLESFRFFEAEEQIHDATVLLQSLGNEVEAQRGKALLGQSTERQQLFAYAILAVGAALLFINGLRRLLYRFSANPLEVEYT